MQSNKQIQKFGRNSSNGEALRTLPDTAGENNTLPANFGTPAYSDLWMDSVVRFGQSAVRSVLFTGANSGNGVTTSAAFFANSLAQDTDRKILLLEANLRKPALHDLFKLNGGITLTGLVSREGSDDFVVPAIHDELYILPGGERSGSPGALFRSGAFHRLYNIALTNFDLVVIDAPPIAHCPETRFLANMVDGVVLVVEADKTRKEVALFAKRRIEESGGTVLGTVLNRTKNYIPNWLYQRV